MLVYAKPTGNDDNNASNEWTDYALSRILSAVSGPDAERLLRCEGHGCRLPGTGWLRPERADQRGPINKPTVLLVSHASGQRDQRRSVQDASGHRHKVGSTTASTSRRSASRSTAGNDARRRRSSARVMGRDGAQSAERRAPHHGFTVHRQRPHRSTNQVLWRSGHTVGNANDNYEGRWSHGRYGASPRVCPTR